MAPNGAGEERQIYVVGIERLCETRKSLRLPVGCHWRSLWAASGGEHEQLSRCSWSPRADESEPSSVAPGAI